MPTDPGFLSWLLVRKSHRLAAENHHSMLSLSSGG